MSFASAGAADARNCQNFYRGSILKWSFDAAREGRVVSDSGVDEQLVVFVLASGKAQGRQNAESQRNNVES